jgi:3-keto steroid reductase
MQHAERRGFLHTIITSVTLLGDFISFLSDKSSGHVLDWLIFNAGVSEVYALDWFTVIKQFLFDTMGLMTLPRYLIERVGSVTEDGIPLVFQANTFGHYYIVLPLTRETPLTSS